MPRKKEKGNNKKKIVIIVILVILICSCLIIARYFYNKHKSNKILNDIKIDETQITDKTTERMLQLQELQKENADIKGWLEIENTNINYPVLQGTDNEYYMTHTYKKEYDIYNASLFLDKDYNWELPSTNLLIYGHNNKNGSGLFHELLNYKEESFYKEHPNVRFTTNKVDDEYEIIAVFESKVYYKSEKNVFRYYYFINAENEKEFNEYIENSKKASLYDTGKTAQYGEQLITLSTCAYHTEDGRFVVVAKKKS